MHKIRVRTDYETGYVEDYARTDNYRGTERNRSGFSLYSIPAGKRWVEFSFKNNEGWTEPARVELMAQ